MGRPRGSQSHLPILTGLFSSLVLSSALRTFKLRLDVCASARHYLIYASLSQCIIPISRLLVPTGNTLLNRHQGARECAALTRNTASQFVSAFFFILIKFACRKANRKTNRSNSDMFSLIFISIQIHFLIAIFKVERYQIFLLISVNIFIIYSKV